MPKLKMKAALISYNQYVARVSAVKAVLEKKGVEAKLFLADYVHNKGYLSEKDKDSSICYVPSGEYNKNLSLRRIKAYIRWSKSVLSAVKEYGAGIIYLLLPPNFLLKVFAQFKKENPKIKLIVDLFDLWPESLPVSKVKKILLYPALKIWRGFRNKNLGLADCVFTECGYYKTILEKQGIKTAGYTVLHLFGGERREDAGYSRSEALRFLYLGSINNIIDIDRIIRLLAALNERRRVTLDIIGNGEQKDIMVAKAQKSGVKTVYHGEVYDDGFKQAIMNECDFGINIYKGNIAVGLTMKSMDYFRGGLPIINTIMGDTFELVESEKIGYNLTGDDKLAGILAAVSADEIEIMRKNVRDIYEKRFTKDVFYAKIEEGVSRANIV